ncbi:STAS domain-containing protein [Fictibacillus iocasae]|uniref:STAS domain-containing protein n=1 Tax=Fictibacillus iocasae TaxID=2715437 RepID=A0ABW2NW56_9BACL
MKLSTENLHALSFAVIEQKQIIAQRVTTLQEDDYPTELRHLASSLIPMREELVELYGKSLIMEDEECFAAFDKWGERVGQACLNVRMPFDAALKETRHFRKEIIEIIASEAEAQNITLKNYNAITRRFHEIMDHAVFSFSLAFISYSDQLKRSAQQSLIEYSVPIVQVGHGVGILPLVGDIDTERARILMEKTPQDCVKLSLNELIIDLSGVPIVDTMVAQQIIRLGDVVNLLGVKPKITGIRPEIAQTMVALNIDFSKFPSFASLHFALEEIGFSINN